MTSRRCPAGYPVCAAGLPTFRSPFTHRTPFCVASPLAATSVGLDTASWSARALLASSFTSASTTTIVTITYADYPFRSIALSSLSKTDIL